MTQLEIVVACGSKVTPLEKALPSNEEQLIIVSVIKPDLRIEIVRQRHDVEQIKSWLCKVLNIHDASVPACLRGTKKNLLLEIKTFYATASDQRMEQFADELFEFRIKHDLRFAFRGTDVPSAIILRMNGNLQIHYKHGDHFFVETIDSYPSIVFPDTNTEKNLIKPNNGPV